MNASTQSQTGGTRHPKSLNSHKASSDDTANGSRSLCGLHKKDRADLAPKNLPIKRDPDPFPKAIEDEAASSGMGVDAPQAISKIIELGGLKNPEIVEKMLKLMQLDRKERKIDLTGRVMLAGIIAGTDTANVDCLLKFVKMEGVTILDEWLQESHKGTKQGEHSNGKAVEELLLALLRALEKLPINLTTLRTCNIGKSVNKLRGHKNFEVQRKARNLVDVWKRRVDEEMKSPMAVRTGKIFDNTIMYNDDDQIILPEDSGPRPTVPGRVQLAIRNNDKAPLGENIQKVMLELTGEEKSPLGLDLVVVLDSSSWIRGEKLLQLKMALLFLMKKLRVVDRLSIVTYSRKAEILCPLRQMAKSSQTEHEDLITSLVQKIKSDSEDDVNIADGLEMALNILKNRLVSSGRVGVIMLMLDRWETRGNVAAVPVGNVPVHTFGVCNFVHDPKVLEVIANNSQLGGTYSAVRDGNLSLAFSQCLAGLLNVVAQDLTVTVSQIKDESTIKQVSAGSYPQSREVVAGSITITFGDIYIREIRKVVVDILLPVTKKEDEADVLKVSYTYRFDGELYEASPQTVTVRRKSGLRAEEQQALPEVRAEEVRLVIAEVIKQATTDADEGDLKSAQDKLANGLLELEDADIEKLKAKLRPELEELLKLMQITQQTDESRDEPFKYSSPISLPFAYSLLISLATQRQMARGSNISKFQLFSTPAMQEFLEEAEKSQDMEDNMQYNNDPDSSVPKPIMPGKVQLEITNNNKVPLETNIQKVLLELSGDVSWTGLDLVAVLDVSSSMEGDKLEKMKMAMLLLMNNLWDKHSLSIVEYSSKAKRLCPLTQMTERSKTKLENLMDDLKPQPGTNMTDGLETALNVLKDRSFSSGRVGVIILMSDGEQNQGGDAADVPVGNVQVFTFRFGEDHNPEVLIAIANNSWQAGTYAQVSNDNLIVTFGHCLDELQRVLVWDLTVTVTQIEKVSTVKRASAGRYLQSVDNAGGSVTIKFGTLYRVDGCKVLVDILLPLTEKEGEVDVLKVSYTYRNSFDGELFVANPAIVTVRRTSEFTDFRDFDDAYKIVDVEVRLLIAEVIKQATGVADKEDLKSVRDELVHSLNTERSNYFFMMFLREYLYNLKKELEELSELMQSQAINEKQGHSFAYSLLISNFTQRGWESPDKSVLFASPAMREFIEEAKMYDEIDDLHVYIDRFICAVESIQMIIG